MKCWAGEDLWVWMDPCVTATASLHSERCILKMSCEVCLTGHVSGPRLCSGCQQGRLRGHLPCLGLHQGGTVYPQLWQCSWDEPMRISWLHWDYVVHPDVQPSVFSYINTFSSNGWFSELCSWWFNPCSTSTMPHRHTSKAATEAACDVHGMPGSLKSWRRLGICRILIQTRFNHKWNLPFLKL